MNEKIVEALKSNNSLLRRKAIMALSKASSEDAIRLLANVYRNDSEPVLRELAKDAALQVRERLNAKLAQEAREKQEAPAPPPKLLGAEKRRMERLEEERAANFNLLIFGVGALVLAAIVMVVVFGNTVSRIIDENDAQATIANALPFPEGDVRFTGALEGKVYRAPNFVLLEPTGAPPSQGWSLLVAVYDGQAQSPVGGLARRAKQENVMLLVPVFTSQDVGAMANELEPILARVKRAYPIDARTTTLYGVSLGATFAAQYVAWYPNSFAIASLGNGRTYAAPPLSTSARYIVFAGQGDAERANATASFIGTLTSLAKKPVQSGVLQGRGAEELPEQVDATFRLIATLRDEG
jgi:predicted esterase